MLNLNRVNRKSEHLITRSLYRHHLIESPLHLPCEYIQGVPLVLPWYWHFRGKTELKVVFISANTKTDSDGLYVLSAVFSQPLISILTHLSIFIAGALSIQASNFRHFYQRFEISLTFYHQYIASQQVYQVEF